MLYLFIIIILELIVFLYLANKMVKLVGLNVEECVRLEEELDEMDIKVNQRNEMIEKLQKDIECYKRELEAQDEIMKDLQENLTVDPVKKITIDGEDVLSSKKTKVKKETSKKDVSKKEITKKKTTTKVSKKATTKKEDK